jgi:hypothetical protein
MFVRASRALGISYGVKTSILKEKKKQKRQCALSHLFRRSAVFDEKPNFSKTKFCNFFMMYAGEEYCGHANRNIGRKTSF